jgi:molybdopterin-guanine dinucleotide biosynthesis protein A
MTQYDALVLAGGRARRLGGADKPAVPVGGVPMIDIVLAAVDGARATIVVGPRRPLSRHVLWTTESPRGGGPVAAIAAGLSRVSCDVVVVLAADLPFVTASTVDSLVEGIGPFDGAVGLFEGRSQPLCAAYRVSSLRAAIDALRPVPGAAVREMVATLRLAHLAEPATGFDCDTWDDVRRADALAGGGR